MYGVVVTKEGPRVLEIQVTRACGRTCRHCAVRGGPGVVETLPMRLLLAAIDDGSAAGYETLRVSGGEPLAYPGLGMLLERAADVGMERHIETSATELTEEHVGALTGAVDGITIGLDGGPAHHDAMRGDGAFFDMVANLPMLGSSGIPFGFRFTARQENLGDVPWAARFAADVGASWLIVQRLQPVGRAAELTSSLLDDLAVLRLRVLCAEAAWRLAERVRLVWQLDPPRARPPTGRCLADSVPLLVVTPDGDVRPGGWREEAAIGNLHRADLPILLSRWRNRPDVSAKYA